MKLSFASSLQKFALGATLAGCLLAASPASATMVRFVLNPTRANAPAGSTSLVYPDQGYTGESYTTRGYTITATGYDNAGVRPTPTELFFKNVGPKGAFETGLGVTNTFDHELQAGSSPSNPFDFIQFDLSMVLQSGATSGQISVASVQSGESFSLFGSNVAGTLGMQFSTTYDSTKDNTFVALPFDSSGGLFKYYSVAAVKGDVIPVELRFDLPAVPEMGALLPIVALLGLVGVAELTRRRRLRA